MAAHLLGIDSLANEDIDAILRDAKQIWAQGCRTRSPRDGAPVVGLSFLQTSLRTRVGFTSACARLGWPSVEVLEVRHSESSMAESAQDTLRVLAGMVDVLIARVPQPIAGLAGLAGLVPDVALINAGDQGLDAEHPTQALIDLMTMESERGPLRSLHVAICGDLRARATRSLLKALDRRPPACLSYISTPALHDTPAAMTVLKQTAAERSLDDDLGDVDVLYVTGIGHLAIPEDVRDTLRVTAPAMSRMSRDAIVLSPMPVIDEIDAEARRDPRMRFFRQSDYGLAVRMAVLNWIRSDRT